MTSDVTLPPAGLRIAAVLWSGEPGGAERFTAELCRVMRGAGADARILFVTTAGPLGRELDAHGIPYTALGLSRGRAVLRSPRRLAQVAASLGPDGVVLVSPGYLAAALRVGGYGGRIVAVLHDLVQHGVVSTTRRVVRMVDLLSGSWACDVEVAVSDYALRARRRHRWRRGRVVRIYNGVDLDVFTPAGAAGPEALTIGWAGRIVDGKGLETLIDALARIRERLPITLSIAGDGPERQPLETRVRERGLDSAVSFAGWAHDMPAFWRAASLAAVPADRLVESFGMVAVEAMACGLPVVASASGALPELVDDGVTGRIVPPGDVDALSAAIVELTADPDRLRAAGAAARARCEARFNLRETAAQYLDLFRAA